MAKSRTLIIRPTLNCNANCTYCYVNHKNKYMQYNVLDILFKRINEYLLEDPENSVELLWHGGEPSLMPIEFWEYTEKLYKKLDQKRIIKSVQTNLIGREALIISQWWLDKGYNVSTSIDGSFEFHSKGRCLTRDDYKILLENVEKLKELRGSIGVVCVISKYQIDYPFELLAFFEKIGANVRFNKVDSVKWRNNVDYKEYYSFLMKVALIWLNDESSNISVEPIESDFASFLGDNKSSCNRNFGCYNQFLAIDFDGSVYPCNRFANYDKWKYGNIEDYTLSEFWNNISNTYFCSINTFEKCEKCSWKRLCGGGCKAQRIFDTKSTSKIFCDSIINYFETLYSILEKKKL